MKGLIVKDLLILKNQMKNLLIILMFFIIFSIINKDLSFITFIIPFYIVMLIISTFSYDEFNHWNTFCNTLPFTRNEIVRAKYILVIVGILLSLAIGLLLACGMTLIDSSFVLDQSLPLVIGTSFGISLTLELLIPFLYKYGVQKGKMAIFAIVIGFSLIMTLIGKTFKFNLNGFVTFIDGLSVYIIVGLLLIITICMIYISYKISCKIYFNKEF